MSDLHNAIDSFYFSALIKSYSEVITSKTTYAVELSP